MALGTIGASSVVDMIKLLGKVVENADNWRVSVDGQKSGPVTHVAFGSAGAIFEFEHNGNPIHLEAKPAPSNHATVVVGQTEDEEAHVVVSHRHQLLKPVILVVEFVDVTIGGSKHRVRFDCPK